MSALPPKADMDQQGSDVRFVRRLTGAASFYPNKAASRFRGISSRASSRVSAIRFVERSTNNFNEGAGCRQIGKAPAIIAFAFPQDYAPMPRLDASRIVKVHDSTAQSNIKAFLTHNKLDDVRIFPLIRYRLRHITSRMMNFGNNETVGPS